MAKIVFLLDQCNFFLGLRLIHIFVYLKIKATAEGYAEELLINLASTTHHLAFLYIRSVL